MSSADWSALAVSMRAYDIGPVIALMVFLLVGDVVSILVAGVRHAFGGVR